MQLEIADWPLPRYLDAVSNSHPTHLDVAGSGKFAGKAGWLALVLEREFGYRQAGIDLLRIQEGPADRVRLIVHLEGVDAGGTNGQSSN